jgi:hypothetical protein
VTTLHAVNKALEAAGRQERLVRGREYYYVAGGGAESWPQSGLYTYSLFDTTTERVISAIDHLKKEAQQ